MSRLNLAIVLALAAAVAGLFYWTLTLKEEIGAPTKLGSPAPGGPPGGGEAARIAEVEKSLIELREMARSAEISANRLGERVSTMEAGNAERDRRVAALARGEAVPEAATPADDTVLSAAIDRVLDRREEEQRRQRLDRMARGMLRYVLADVPATDTQREELVKVLVAYIEGRDKVRRDGEEAGADNTAREAELAALEAKRDEEVQRIFGAGDFSKIQERLSRGRRGPDGRRGNLGPGGMGPGGFGPGRTSPGDGGEDR